MQIGLPFSILLLSICWVYLTQIAFNFNDEQNQSITTVKEELIKLGAMSVEEKRVLTIFILTALGWLSRSYLQNFIPQLNDSIIALSAMFLLFFIFFVKNPERHWSLVALRLKIENVTGPC